MAQHDPIDMTPRSITCNCGRVLRLSAVECDGFGQPEINDVLLDRLSDHAVSMEEQGR